LEPSLPSPQPSLQQPQMATSKDDEVRAIEEAHRAAQARLGIAGAYLAMSEWGSVNPLNASESGSSWVARSLILINAIRRKSSRLAATYVRLVRALETGYTLDYPEYSDNPDTLTLGDLRTQLRDVLLEIANIDHEATDTDNEAEERFEAELRRAQRDPEPRQDRINFSVTEIDDQIQNWLDNADDNDDDRVTVEDFDWGSDMEPEQIQDAFQKALTEQVVETYEKQTKAIWRDEELTGRQAQAKVDKAFSAAGSLGGGRVDRYGISGGREVIDRVIAMDRRVMAWARGTRPNCCAFCALLASRGWVYKKNAGTLAKDADGNYYQGTRNRTTRAGNEASADSFDANGIRKYHDNCKCFLIVRWVDNPDLPEQSKTWAKDYAEKIAPNYSYGNGTNNALNAWRRLLNDQRRADGTYVRKNR